MQISNAHVVVGAMDTADLLKAFRLTQKLEDYIIDLVEQCQSVDKPVSRSLLPASSNEQSLSMELISLPSASGINLQQDTNIKQHSIVGSSYGKSDLCNYLNTAPSTYCISQDGFCHSHQSTSEEIIIPPLNHSPAAPSTITDEADSTSSASIQSAQDYQTKMDAFPPFPSGSVFPGPHPLSPLHDIDQEETENPEPLNLPSKSKYSHVYVSPTLPTEDVWQVAVCLLSGPEIDQAPSAEQITEWTLIGQGLPQNQDSVKVDQHWSMKEFADFIVQLYPHCPKLPDIGYTFCIADTSECHNFRTLLDILILSLSRIKINRITCNGVY